MSAVWCDCCFLLAAFCCVCWSAGLCGGLYTWNFRGAALRLSWPVCRHVVCFHCFSVLCRESECSGKARACWWDKTSLWDGLCAEWKCSRMRSRVLSNHKYYSLLSRKKNTVLWNSKARFHLQTQYFKNRLIFLLKRAGSVVLAWQSKNTRSIEMKIISLLKIIL